MVFNAVSGGYYAATQFRMGCGACTDAEKSCVNPFTGENFQNSGGYLGVRTVIDGDRNFVSLHRNLRQFYQVGPQASAAWPQTHGQYRQLTGHNGQG